MLDIIGGAELTFLSAFDRSRLLVSTVEAPLSVKMMRPQEINYFQKYIGELGLYFHGTKGYPDVQRSRFISDARASAPGLGVTPVRYTKPQVSHYHTPPSLDTGSIRVITFVQ